MVSTRSGILLLHLALVACQTVEPADEHLATTVQALGETQSIISSLSPEGYWRVGELSGTTVYDSSSHQINGNYYGSYSLGRTGAVANDNDTAVGFQGTYAWAEVPRQNYYSLTRASSDFGWVGPDWGVTPVTGDQWVAQVTTDAYHYYRNYGAYIDPFGTVGTFQQGLVNVNLSAGEMQVKGTWSIAATGGSLQPIVLVAQRTDDNNMIRAELIEHTDHSMELALIKVVNGVNEYLDQEMLFANPYGCTSVITDYTVGDWWFLRFHFDGPILKARAWAQRSAEPNCWQAQGVASSSTSGSVAIRSANSASTVQPVVQFQDFWAQTLGFSLNAFVKVDPGGSVQTFPITKGGDDCYLCDEDSEYYFRYEPEYDSLKAYVFNPEGGKGAGQEFTHITPGVWYHIVMELDPGDANSLQDGIGAYIDGKYKPPTAGSTYNGEQHCVEPGTSIPTSCPNEGIGNNTCESIDDHHQHICWRVTPRMGNAPFRLAWVDPDHASPPPPFAGTVDEVALFSRKLTCSEVSNIYNASCIKASKTPIARMIATASSSTTGAPASNAIDLNMSTYWSPSGAFPQWITFDFGTIANISSVKIFWGLVYASSYWIRVSNDNVTWTLATVNGTADGGEDDLFVGRQARYIQVYALAKAGGRTGIALNEFQAYACQPAPANCTFQCNKNSICEAGEEPNTCGTDCRCNYDGICKASAGEDSNSCPSDCYVLP